MQNLREHLRDVLRREITAIKRRHGSALVAEGKHKRSSRHSRSHSRKGSAFLGEALYSRRSHRSRHSRHGSAMLAEGKRKKHSMHSRRSHSRYGSAFVAEGKHKRHSMHSRRSHSRHGSALIGLPYRSIGSAKTVGRKRGSPKALLEINKYTKMYQNEGLDYKEAHKMGVAEYRKNKTGSGRHRSKHSRHSRKSHSRRY